MDLRINFSKEDLIEKYAAKKSNLSERTDVLRSLCEEVNKERSQTKFYVKDGKKIKVRPLTVVELNFRLSHIPTKDLYYLKSICLDSKNRGQSFSKCLFGSIKVK